MRQLQVNGSSTTQVLCIKFERVQINDIGEAIKLK